MPFAINSFTSYAITLKKTFQKRLYFHTLEQSLMFFEGHLAYSIGPKHPPQGKFVLGLLLEPNLLVHTTHTSRRDTILYGSNTYLSPLFLEKEFRQV